MDIVVIDHPNKFVYSNLHEFIGGATLLLDVVAQFDLPGDYIICSYSNIPHFGLGSNYHFVTARNFLIISLR